MWWLRRHCLRLLADRFGSKAVLCGRGQFESLAPPKNDASGPEQVSGAIIAAPPRFIRTDSKSFEQFQIRSGPPKPPLEHLPDQAGFLVGFNILEPVQDLPHDLQVRRPLADSAPEL